MHECTVRDVQNKILEIAKFIDNLCRENDISYYIMGGTALGAVRHGGFIPWDDDLDIFMTPDQYEKFKTVFQNEKSDLFVLQEWGTDSKYLEYAKVRMNGTTFIEKSLKDRLDLHHGIYVDIMILHKIPDNKLIQTLVYLESQFITVYSLSKRNWKPKTKVQAVVLQLLKILPCKLMNRIAYSHIYSYERLKENYKFSYWFAAGKIGKGLYDADFFEKPVDIAFEDTNLLASPRIREYLTLEFGDYMQLPSEEERKAAVHAFVFDTEKDYTEYMGKV